jgi:hypothetical protein
MKKAILIGDAGLDGKLDSKLVYYVHPLDSHRYNDYLESKPINLKLSDLLVELKKYGVSVDTYPIGNSQKI